MPAKNDINNNSDVLSSLKKEITEKDNIIKKLYSLIEVNSIITSSLEKKKVLQNIIDQTKLLMDCQKSSILLVDTSINCLKFEVLTQEEEEDQLQDIHLKMGEGIAGSVWQKGKPVLIADARKDIRFSQKADDKTNFITTSLIAVPLIVNGQVIGVMEAINKEDNTPFNSFDLEILNNLSIQAAIAIENANLYDLAITDGLTRLFIHRYFQKRIKEEFNRALRYDNDLSLIMFDLDHFKKVNDVYGHQTGDQVLMAIADIIKANSRSCDLPCRYGGEEICVILPQTGNDGALILAERIRKKIDTSLIIPDKKSLHITVSGGISSLKKNKPNTKDRLIKMADSALYYSKANGRNRVSSYSKEIETSL